MTGYDIFRKAAVMLGLQKDENGNGYKQILPEVALCAVNEIGADLSEGFGINDIFGAVDLPQTYMPAFVSGVAMVLSAALENYEASLHFTRLYNARRAAVKNGTGSVKNVIPFVQGGGV